MVTHPDDLHEELQNRKTYHSGRDKNFERWSNIYYQKIDCKSPEEGIQFVPPDGRREVEKGASQVATGVSIMNVYPDVSEDDKAIGKRLRTAYDLSAKRSWQYNRVDVDRVISFFLSLYGIGVRKGPFFRQDFVDKGLFPIVSSPVDPSNFYPSADGNSVVVVYEKPVSVIKREIEQWNANATGGDKRRKKPYNTDWFGLNDFSDERQDIQWIEYYTAEKRCFAIARGGVQVPILGIQSNVLEYLPFHWAFSGKQRGADGPPEEACVGVLAGMEEAIENLARTYTAMAYHVRLRAYGREAVASDARDDYNQKVSPGDQFVVDRDNMPSEGGIESIPEINMNSDMYPFLGQLSNYVQQLGGPQAVMGDMAAGESGQARLAQVRQASQHYRPMREAKCVINSEYGTCMSKLIRNRKVVTEPIHLIGSETINGANISKYTYMEETLAPKEPSEMQEEREQDLRALERGAMTLQMYADRADYDNKETILSDIMAEKLLLNSPEIQQAFAMRTIESWGMQDVIDALTQQQQHGQNAASSTQTIDPREMGRAAGPAGEMPVG